MKKRRKIEKSSPEFIKIGRQKLGFTQKQLAEELSVCFCPTTVLTVTPNGTLFLECCSTGRPRSAARP